MVSQQKPWWAPDLQTTIAVFVILMATGALFYRMVHPSQVEDKQLDTMLTIVFSTALVTIINFLFGSSRSSQNKDDAIAQIALQPSPAPAPVAPAAPPPAGG